MKTGQWDVPRGSEKLEAMSSMPKPVCAYAQGCVYAQKKTTKALSSHLQLPGIPRKARQGCELLGECEES